MTPSLQFLRRRAVQDKKGNFDVACAEPWLGTVKGRTALHGAGGAG